MPELDFSLPLMTEDGRPVQFVRPAKSTSSVIVMFKGPYDKRFPDRALEDQHFPRLVGGIYYTREGGFCGGHPDSNYRIVNVDEPVVEEDWS